MSLPIPLGVVLSTARGQLDVTHDLDDLVTRWDDHGYASCQIALDRPLTLQPDEIAYYGGLTVYDNGSAAVVWDGRQEDPGRSAGDGQVWDITAVGGQAHTLDRTIPLIYVDQPLSGLDRVDNITPGATDTVGNSPGSATGDDQWLVLQWPQGLTVVSGGRCSMRYNDIFNARQKLGRVSYGWDAGVTGAGASAEAVTRLDGILTAGFGEVVATATFNTAGGTGTAVIVTDFPAGRNTVEFRIWRNAATGTIVGDDQWAAFQNIKVHAVRFNKSGTELLTAASYTTDTVLASQVVEDLLGRLLTSFDGANATVTTTSYAIDKLAYPDGVTANKMLADLMEIEAGYTWRVWERAANGKYRFEWTTIPTTVRYEADVLDGYDSQGSADGLYSRVLVRWKDPHGRTRSVERASTVPILDDAGLIRQGQLDLGDEVGSSAAAIQAGDQWLLDRKYPPNAGRLRIARPILDLETGRRVMPWEIRPGLIRVRGVMPRLDALNTSTRDGVTIFRIVASEFRASDGAATLDLDSYAPSTERMLADLSRRPVYRRR